MKTGRDRVIFMLRNFALFVLCSANILEADHNLGAPSYIRIVEKVNLVPGSDNESVWADTPNETSYGYGTKYEPLLINEPTKLLELPSEDHTIKIVVKNNTEDRIVSEATISTPYQGFSISTPTVNFSNATVNYSESSDMKNTEATILNETITASSQVTTTVSSETINHSETSANGEETTTNTPKFITTETDISSSPNIPVTSTQYATPEESMSTAKASIPPKIHTSTENPPSITDAIPSNSTIPIGQNSTELEPNSINKYQPSTLLVLVVVAISSIRTQG